MPRENDIERIYHIKSYCSDINATIERFGRDFDVFSKDKDFFNSISMSLMQIGELSIGLSDEFKEKTEHKVRWYKIKGLRNRFAHEYVRLVPDMIWEAATVNIPELEKICDSFIEVSTDFTPSIRNRIEKAKKELSKNKTSLKSKDKDMEL